MTRKLSLKRTLIAGLILLSLGGWLLHLRAHPPVTDETLIPFATGLISVFLLPILFSFRKTLVLAYLTNGFIAIIGTILMAHFSIANFEPPVTLKDIFLGTTFMHIMLLWGKFIVGKAIFDLEFLKTDTDPAPKGRFFRYPNTGWWLVHLVTISIVYALGNIFWK